MRQFPVGPVPGVLFGLTVAAELVAAALAWGLQSPLEAALSGLYAVYAVVLAGAGALIAARHPRNAIGWLFVGFALLNALASDLAFAWSMRAAVEGWSGAAVAGWISATSWLPSGFGWTLTFLLFPDGHLLGRRWWPVPWIGLAGTILAGLGWSLNAELGRELPGGENPFAVLERPTAALLSVGMTLFLGALAAAVASLVLRFRRSSGVQRQRIKWFVFAAALAGVALPLSFALWFVTPAAQLLAALALTALPISATIGILRHRLLDVDLLINRPVVYGVVTVLLAIAHGATVVLLGLALGQGSAVATAAATLVVAVGFHPVRVRVQDVVDRRFNRARYHALRRMADFLEDLRAGFVLPEQIEPLLAELLKDPELQLFVFLPQSQMYVDLTGSPVDDCPDDDRSRVAVQAGGAPLAVVVHESRLHDTSLHHAVVESGGLAIEIAPAAGRTAPATRRG